MSLRQKFSASQRARRPSCLQAATPVIEAHTTQPKIGHCQSSVLASHSGQPLPLLSTPPGPCGDEPPHNEQRKPVTAEMAATKMLLTKIPTESQRTSQQECTRLANIAQAQCTGSAREPPLPSIFVAAVIQGTSAAGKAWGAAPAAPAMRPRRTPRPTVTRKPPRSGDTVESTALRQTVYKRKPQTAPSSYHSSEMPGAVISKARAQSPKP
mmetsp:Transcript_57972/g.168132  ORF Transcript_57972/g.168132 Transcript_57972/m.168132 type:complete len:211 (-) Transcript_57972:291-923(-)